MDSLLLPGQILSLAAWIIFWATIAILNSIKKNELNARLAGVKKLTATVVGLFGFFWVLNILIEVNSISSAASTQANLLGALLFFGYILLLGGFGYAMWVAWSLQKPLDQNESRLGSYKRLRNAMYTACVAIAFGSALVTVNPAAVTLSVLLVPALYYRAKSEDKANAALQA